MAGTVDVKSNGNGSIVVTITPDKDGEPSKSGKSKIFASTGGFMGVAGGYKLSLNLIR